MGLAFLITTDNLQLLSERKVLREAEYAALLDAAALVDAARKEAQRIVGLAVQAGEDMRRQGYQQGLERAQAEYAERLVSGAMSAERQLQGLRQPMAQMVVKAVTQFVHQADPAQLFEAALLRVDSLLRTEPFITVRVPADHEPAMRQAVARLRDAASWHMTVNIIADTTLPDGACVVQTASGTLQLGVDAQLEALRRAVERSGPARGAEAA